MAEPEDHGPPTDGPTEPGYLRRARDMRTTWDLLFPPFVGVVVVVLLVVLVLTPSLQSPAILGVIGSALVALAGLGIRKQR